MRNSWEGRCLEFSSRFPVVLLATVALCSGVLSSVSLAGFGGFPIPAAQEPAETGNGEAASGSASDGERQPFDRQSFLDSFDLVWQTVRERHWDAEKAGAAWDAAREHFRPIVERAEDAATARQAMNELLASLNQSHFVIIARDSYESLERLAASGGEGWSGLVVRLIDSRGLVLRVAPESPAAQAGIRPGWELVTVRGKPVSRVVESTRSQAGDHFMRAETVFGLTMDAICSGAVGEQLTMELVDYEGQPVEIGVTLVAGPGQPARFGFLPVTQVEYRSSRLEAENGAVAFLAFNAFLDGPRLIREFSRSVEMARDCRGLIIDLRGNMGGIVGLTMGMCGWLFDEPRSLGIMQSRAGRLELNLNPRKPALECPVAVLIDECSISAAEIMAGALQDLGRVRVFGRRSAGMVLPSTVVRLPNGDGFQYALSDYVTANGRRLEAAGVVPDEAIAADRAALAAASAEFGHDPDIDAAVAWILSVHDTGGSNR